MPVINRVSALADEITGWRRDFHQHPELLYAVDRTAGIVAEKLRAFGCDEVVTGLGKTGVVGLIRGRRAESGRTIGLRADMDALPIEEATQLPYRSTVPGTMHACGHDGHTAMLLGAARYLAETRNFDGTAVVIFQPAEEGGGGGAAMVKDGLMERFGIQEVYGLHNKPGLPLGSFAIRPGPIMAAADRFTITIEGRGGHAAAPHDCIDTVVVAAQIITALQSVVARNADPIASAVVSVTTVRAGDAFNVIPQTAVLNGTVRCLAEPVRALCEARIGALAAGIAEAFGARATTHYVRGYPVTDNHPDQAAFMADVAEEVAGEAGVNRAVDPMMGAEDFSYMLEERPGAYIFLGTGDGPGLHHPAYDFNDAATPYGVSLWARLIERAMPA
ncbi:amidohydrolase [Methylobacterium sp. 4-46]|uniref:M20 aminoacylase family protein n=1 Tax=unclassified Methylobacterium TaxID=2615210 RepID=UPI000165C9D9|nr:MULTISPECIES: M20 aminoacylase family protein [Methylobacterium]ACA17593.1 amidohydrolase [Methylobacterium sp. 4-46]WFT83269.1 M20 family metallopeptidase [Methylobacterium nodulans]